MLRVATRLSRRALSSVESHSSVIRNQSCVASSVQRAPGIRHSVLDDFLIWGALGSHGFSSFASGFSPLKHKPLESIIDVHRAKLQTPEDLATIWDDVSSFDLLGDWDHLELLWPKFAF